MEDRSHQRHLAKAVTWRLVGTVDTIFLAWIISGNAYVGLKIGLSEVITKIFFYYFHERLWSRLKMGVKVNGVRNKRRHLLKTISWRTVGTLDTIILTWIITGNAFTGIKIGIAEVVTKMILYYLHERVWYRSNFQIKERRRIEKSGSIGGKER